VDIGAAIIALASLFLLYSAGKSSLTLCFAVLLLTSVTSVIRPFWLRAIILLTPLLLLNLLSIGTVMFEGLAGISKLLPFDSTFTGRTDIWAFALQSLHARWLTGYGFASFWGSSAIQNLPRARSGPLRRAQPQWLSRHRAGHGRPGLLLLILVLVIVPLRIFSGRTRAATTARLP
jgi:O-antigen ligase